MERENSHQNGYRPSDAYLPLIDREATTEQLIGLLLNQASPFLPVRVLREDGREEAIDGIDSLRRYLYVKFRIILDENGLSDLSRRMSGAGRILDIEEICRNIEGPALREIIRKILGRERSSLTADFLERLGFLPRNEFARDTATLHAGQVIGQTDLFVSIPRDEVRRVEEMDRKSSPLKQFFPPWFLQDHLSAPQDLVPNLRPNEQQEYPIYARLARWITDAREDFQVCVREADQDLARIFTTISPKGPVKQNHETVSDLGTKSFAALLEIMLNRRISLRRRLEACRLLEWAITYFSWERNPVVQAQQAVRRDIHQKLAIEVWEFPDRFPPIKIAPEIVEVVYEEENGDVTVPGLANILAFFNQHPETVGPELRPHIEALGHFLHNLPNAIEKDKPIIQTGRKVQQSVQAILQECEHISQPDRVIFASREKSKFSTALKIFLYQELARKCQATLRGIETGLTKAYAGRKLREFRSRMSATHRTSDLAYKPVGIDAIDDAVGFSIAINLKKPLQNYRGDERKELNKLFRTLGEFLANKLGLTRVRRENLLWNRNSGNKKTSKAFRVYKVHGNYEIEAEVFEEGRLLRRTVKVPVEIQLHTTESHLRMYFPGETGTEQYTQRKAKDIAERLRPDQIGDEHVYPSLDLHELEEFLEKTL